MGAGIGGKAPAPPDYTAAAEAQAEGSRQNVVEQTYANRPDINTPYGSISWERPEYPGAGDAGGYGGEGGGGPSGLGSTIRGVLGQGGGGEGGGGGYDPTEWAMNLNLPPEMLEALQSQQRIASGRSRMGEALLGQAGADLSGGMDWGSLPGMTGGADARNRAEQAIYERAASRLDPMWQQRTSGMETQLANQGLTPGSEAYDRAMGNLGRDRTDAYQTAIREAIMGGGSEASRQQALDLQARQQGISEGLQRQYGGMNALNAFLSGQQVGMPQMPGFNTAGQAQAPQYLNAANMQYQGDLNQYGANQASLQGLMGGMGSFLPYML